MNGRIFAHTLLFLIVISAAGLLLYRCRGSTWLVVLSFGSAMHLLEDAMWDGCLRTLFWPLGGWSFDRLDLEYWLGGLWQAFLHVPSVYVPEWTGIAAVAGFASWLVYRKNVRRFLREGRIV